MLVLSRKPGESLVIGGGDSGCPLIRIMCLEVRNGDKVRLGIEAPQDVPVHRLEIAQAIAADRAKEQR